MQRMARLKAAVARLGWSGRVFVQYGMKRSGNHAISNWLVPKLGATHFNNVVPMGEVYAGRRALPDHPEFLSWYFSEPVSSVDAGRGPLTGFAPIRRPVYASFEDVSQRADMFRANAPVRILVIRSFENMMSSRIHKGFKVDMPAYPQALGPVMSRVIETWKDHATCYLAGNGVREGRIAIHFDSWCRDRGYRDAICRRLAVEPGDEGIARVSDTGGGSSFDGVEFDGDATAMALDRRQEALAGPGRRLFEQVMADPELRELVDRVAAADPYRQL